MRRAASGGAGRIEVSQISRNAIVSQRPFTPSCARRPRYSSG